MNSHVEISRLETYINHIGGFATSEKSHLYRGQEDAEWGVTSSALRRLSGQYASSSVSLPSLCSRYLRQIVDDSQLNYPSTYRGLYPLECLAHLQHNGVATGLIDFTFNPLVALWFACAYETADTDGKVIVVENERGRIEEITTEKLESGLDTLFDPTGSQWHLWTPALDSQVVDTQRITRQHSVFLFGLPEVARDMFACEIVIPYAHKEGLRTELANVGISERTLFADLLGFFERNTHAQPYEHPLLEPDRGETLR